MFFLESAFYMLSSNFRLWQREDIKLIFWALACVQSRWNFAHALSSSDHVRPHLLCIKNDGRHAARFYLFLNNPLDIGLESEI